MGDWDGDAKSEIGVYRPSENELLLDTSMDGVADISVVLENGVVGYPVSGDWDGNGSDDPAVLDTSGQWQLYRLVGDEITQWSTVQFGAPGDTSFAGDWNGDGMDTPGVYTSSTGQVLFTDENPPNRSHR